MIKIESVLLASALTILLGASLAFAQTGTASGKTATPAKDSAAKTVKPSVRTISDASFAKMAAEGGLAEVKLGQLAEDKGATQAVKDFGKRMVTDHSKADDQLKTAAEKDNITLPVKLSARDQATYDQLSKLSGQAFDRAYARDMVRDHSADVAQFQRESKDGKDAAIKDFASQTLPTLEDHLKSAREMLSSSSATGTTQSKTTRRS